MGQGGLITVLNGGLLLFKMVADLELYMWYWFSRHECRFVESQRLPPRFQSKFLESRQYVTGSEFLPGALERRMHGAAKVNLRLQGRHTETWKYQAHGILLRKAAVCRASLGEKPCGLQLARQKSWDCSNLLESMSVLHLSWMFGLLGFVFAFVWFLLITLFLPFGIDALTLCHCMFEIFIFLFIFTVSHNQWFA